MTGPSGPTRARPDRRIAADRSHAIARAAFWVTLVLAPFRLTLATASRDVPGVFHDYSDLRLYAVDIALAIVLAAGLAALAAGGHWTRVAAAMSRSASARLALVAAAAFLALVWAGVAVSVDPLLSMARAVEVTAFAGLALYVAAEVRSAKDVAVPVALSVLVQSVVAIAQVATQGSIGLGAMGERTLDPAVPGISVVVSDAGVRLLRGYGLTDHPNILGGTLAVGLVVLAWTAGLAGMRRVERTRLAEDAPGRTGRPPFVAGRPMPMADPRTAVLLIAALGVVALALTFSRGAWIALIAGALVAAGLAARTSGLRAARAWLALAAALPLALAVMAIPLGPYLGARLDAEADRPTTETRSYDERIALAQAALRVVEARPILGSGIGTMPQAIVSDAAVGYPPQPAHLVPLLVAAEAGLPAAVAYLVLVAGAFVAVANAGRRRQDAGGLVPLAGGLLVVITTVGLFDHYPLTSPGGEAWLAIALGLCLGLPASGPALAPSGEPTVQPA